MKKLTQDDRQRYAKEIERLYNVVEKIQHRMYKFDRNGIVLDCGLNVVTTGKKGVGRLKQLSQRIKKYNRLLAT